MPPEWKVSVRQCTNGDLLLEPTDLYEKIQKQAAGAKSATSYVYNMYIDNQGQALKIYWKRWLEIGFCIEFHEYQKCFEDLFRITKVTKYRDFQYRLLLGKIVTNSELYKWGLRESSKCDFCQEPDQHIFHLMWECREVQKLYNKLSQRWNTLEIDFSITMANILLNTVYRNPNHIANFIILFTKQYIHSKRCFGKRLNMYELENQLEYFMNVSRFNCIKEGEFKKFCKCWGLVQPSLKRHDKR